MDLAEAGAGHVGVDLGRADARMAEQFLDHAQVSAVFQEMRGKAVSQHVGRDVAGNARPGGALLDPEPERHRGKRRAAPGQKHRSR